MMTPLRRPVNHRSFNSSFRRLVVALRPLMVETGGITLLIPVFTRGPLFCSRRKNRLTMMKTAFALLAILLISSISSRADEPKAAVAADTDAFPRGEPANLGISADA